MVDLSNIFNKDIKKAILSKEQLAEMLKVTPEAFLKEWSRQLKRIGFLEFPKIIGHQKEIRGVLWKI